MSEAGCPKVNPAIELLAAEQLLAELLECLAIVRADVTQRRLDGTYVPDDLHRFMELDAQVERTFARTQAAKEMLALD